MRVVRNLLLSLASVAALLVALELVLQVRAALSEPDAPREVPRVRACGDCPHLYEPNPERPDVSAQGLRDRAYVVPKPADRFRILVLGDSVAGGFQLPVARSFPEVLERRLAPVEVVNASAAGWSTWNELHFYLARGRAFEPDLVIVALCLNDVVDPALHWLRLLGPQAVLPAGSIPDPRYHDEHIAGRLRLRRLADSPSQLLRELGPRLDDFWYWRRFAREGWRDRDRARIPVFLTYEDTLPIDVWMDPESAQWRWLREKLERLEAAVRADGAAFALIVLPLAYQLDAAYPYLPQQVVARYCEQRSWLCIDVLPELRRYRAEEVFQLDAPGYHDVWHLTPRGHRVVAHAVERRLRDAGLVPPAGRR